MNKNERFQSILIKLSEDAKQVNSITEETLNILANLKKTIDVAKKIATEVKKETALIIKELKNNRYYLDQKDIPLICGRSCTQDVYNSDLKLAYFMLGNEPYNHIAKKIQSTVGEKILPISEWSEAKIIAEFNQAKYSNIEAIRKCLPKGAIKKNTSDIQRAIKDVLSYVKKMSASRGLR